MVEIAILPRNLSLEKKFLLTGKYPLQMIQITDISKPKLWQIQKIRSSSAKNTEADNDFGKRVLQLTLTDGVQQVEAMEFKPIPCLNLNLPPGVKIQIVGPLMVRNGRLMLETQHVKVLGGHVEEDRVKYAAENVLARALGLEENPDPYIINENILEAVERTENTQLRNISTTQDLNPQNQIRKNVRNNRNTNSSNKPVAVVHPQIPPDFEVDDELLQELECGNLNEIPLQHSSAQKNRRVTDSSRNPPISEERNVHCKSPDLFDEANIDEDLLNDHLDNIDFESDVLEGTNLNKVRKDVNNSGTSLKVSDGNKESENVITIHDSFDDIDIDSHLDNIDLEMAHLPSSTQIQITSPVLKKKSRSLESSNIKSSNMSVKNLQKTSKTVAQTTLNFEKSTLLDTSSTNTDKYSPVRPVLTETESNMSKTSPKINILPIEKLNRMVPNIGKGKFKIKAKFKKVVEKMVTKGNTYNLVIKVEDSTGDMIVRVHSDVVESFVGVPANEIENLKELVYKDDKAAKDKILGFLRKIHEACVSLNAILEVHVARGEDYPVLAKIISENH
ncbi:recQ-mediated genome instability protein 1-like isoform X2 [Sitophilus oryzae]|nr:recQ-mediated genome instability protein 1-like isoform X2 [Sitophilus oryzae]